MTASPIEFLESTTPRRLHLILLPTEACNFRCVYCYESFRLKRMEPRVVSGLKRLLDDRAPSLGRLTISWFGGEPLLARDIMEEVLDHVAALRADHTGLDFASDITTNASLLTPAVLESLVRRGVSEYQVTFDGPKAFHDRKRIRPGGKPTFDRVWGNLVDCRKSAIPFRVQLRLHVDRENAAAMPGFLDEIHAAFGGDDRFEVYLRGLSKLGGPNDPFLPILEGSGRAATIAELRGLAAARGLRLAGVPVEPGVCYAARGNSFVIRSDGRVNKCTVALDHPANQVGVLEADGTLRLRTPTMRPWMRGFESGNRSELACPMHGLADSEPHRSAATILPDTRSVALAAGGAA